MTISEENTARGTAAEDVANRAGEAVRRIEKLGPQLNDRSDELTRVIERINTSLQTLNLGLSTWVPFEPREEAGADGIVRNQDGSGEAETRLLGYARVNTQWGLAIRTTGANADGEPFEKEWLFANAPRHLRCAAVGRLADVIEALAETAEQTAGDIQRKVATASMVADAVEKHQP